ncbi:alpha/beta hydrolase [Pedococcus sp. KACC 23699]|uniref:Alpha/beta hydrolase n=1 Tax=Pedococcus sp. KACC 23699 TaxID=3149228 RepID=A0AAU7JVD6_9MICO
MTISDVSGVIERDVVTAKGRVHVNEYPGEGPPIVLTHGFPDDSRIYKHLLPELSGRHAITFDFLGHGRSARVDLTPMESGQREGELAAIVEQLGLDRPILVGHDIGGPVAIRYAIANPASVGGLVLLNTFFGDAPTLVFPEFIRMLADRHLAPLVDAIIADPTTLGWMLFYTSSTLNPGPVDLAGLGGQSILPQFFGDDTQLDAVPAIRAWSADLFPGLQQQNSQIARGELGRLDVPVTIAFGEHDRYLNQRVAEHLHTLFPGSVLHPISGAAHWPQWDQPAATAAVIVETAQGVQKRSTA